MVTKTKPKAAPRAAAKTRTAAAAKRAAPARETVRKPAPAAAAKLQINRVADTARTIQKEAIEMTKNDFMPAMDMTAATDRVKAMFDGKGMMERTSRAAQEAAELAKGNVEAIVESTRIAAQNANTIGQDVAELGRKGFEGASEAMKGFAEAKSPVELLRLQGEFAKSSMETMFSEGARMSEAMVKLMGEAMAPVSNRFAVAAERAKTLAA